MCWREGESDWIYAGEWCVYGYCLSVSPCVQLLVCLLFPAVCTVCVYLHVCVVISEVYCVYRRVTLLQ